ncbi:DgyrCDS14665 [Dimorphilus gyrociliatus]|uniref:DgyrCDS14665 n=1 Tax=Dimorphilus gyrociliatus TaxID=2664684 RepID=A0A7I8WEF2_9ANNE|nr:DgyrCDS14665 [Dimorphilus gyrociliatus]
MAGMKFEYDEKGGTFYYFLISFYVLVLIPATYYGWLFIRKKENKEVSEKDCRCLPCLNKEKLLETTQPKQKVKRPLVIILLIIGWSIFFFLAYKTSQIELDYSEYDPYTILELERGSSVKEIKSQYRKLSKKHHPDKGGDHKTFMKIAKAYAALTDEESRKNWEEYGNPDGPTATNFGIALPIWIVEKQNSMWVLGLYALVFMIILPVVVGTWWYRSIQFSGDQVLLDTMKFYGQFFSRTPNMTLKRILMILGGSFEFSKFYNKDIIDRESDNIEIPQLMKELPNLNEKNKEKPFNLSYSLKARALIHAHLGRISLPPTTLENDKNYVLGKYATKAPRLNTVEYCIKICQMLVQACGIQKVLAAITHITKNAIHFVTKRRCIKTIKQFVEMKSKERRALLRTLSDAEYSSCDSRKKTLEPNESDEEDEKREDAGDKMEEERKKLMKNKTFVAESSENEKEKAKKPKSRNTHGSCTCCE